MKWTATALIFVIYFFGCYLIFGSAWIETIRFFLAEVFGVNM